MIRGDAHKENLVPPRQERECQEKDNSKNDWEVQHEAFEAEVEAGTAPDIVQLWCDYVKWSSDRKDADPDFESTANSILQRACFSLSADASHRDDVRHLRLWVRHANVIEDPEKVFEVLSLEGIGTRHALFYEAWAASLEKKRLFDEVQCLYERGLHMEAQPVERLQSRYQEFQRRQKRRAKRAATSTSKLSVSQDELQSTSNFVPCLSPSEEQARSNEATNSKATTSGEATLENERIEISPRGDESRASSPSVVRRVTPSELLDIEDGRVRHQVREFEGGSLETADLASAENPKVSSALALAESHSQKRVLEFGPRHPEKEKEKASKGIFMHFRRTEFGFEYKGEIASVEEVRAAWVFEQMRKDETVEAEESDADKSSATFAREDRDKVVHDENFEHRAENVDAKDRLNAGGELKYEIEQPSSSSLPSMDVPSVIDQNSCVGSLGSCSIELTREQQEVTTTCVRSLLRDSKSSRPSLASSTFEDPTYTMQEVQREVLGFFSSDSPLACARKGQAGVSDSPSSLELEARSTQEAFPKASFDIFEDTTGSHEQAVLPKVGFEVYEDTNTSSFPDAASAKEASALPGDGFQIFQDSDVVECASGSMGKPTSSSEESDYGTSSWTAN